jgi:putative copper export protein
VDAVQHFKRELPGILIYSVAITAGVLAALAVQIWFTHVGYDPVGMWQHLFSSRTLQLRAAGPWWVMAGAAFIASGATAAALSRLPLPWRRQRIVRWILGGLLIFALAHVGHSAPAAGTEVRIGPQVAARCAWQRLWRCSARS